MLCDSPVVLCCRYVLKCQYLSSTLHCHISCFFQHFIFAGNLVPPSSGTCVLSPVCRTVHWAHVPEDGGSKLLVKIHYSNSHFVCLQIGRTQGQLRMISHCRGYVWSPTNFACFEIVHNSIFKFQQQHMP